MYCIFKMDLHFLCVILSVLLDFSSCLTPICAVRQTSASPERKLICWHISHRKITFSQPNLK
uniref:Uncharacterized protein n=1 Tax=Anguilla anguilla TaxID=7936 RepID=A0A0E9SCG8_ANGAN